MAAFQLAATKIQKHIRGYLSRKGLSPPKPKPKSLRPRFRRSKYNRPPEELNYKHFCATTIQSAWKTYQIRTRYIFHKVLHLLQSSFHNPNRLAIPENDPPTKRPAFHPPGRPAHPACLAGLHEREDLQVLQGTDPIQAEGQPPRASEDSEPQRGPHY